MSERKKQDSGNLKKMLREVLRGGMQGGLTGLKSSQRFLGFKNKPIKGFQQGLKRKDKQVLGREITKRARDIFGV